MALSALSRGQRLIVGTALGLTAIAGAARLIDARNVATFALAALALAAMAAVVGQSIEQVGERMGPGATGLLQSALGNLPELFVGIFALRAGLVDVVRAALIGSILANTLLVLGIAILAGGLRHGTEHFDREPPRMIGTLLLLAVAALLVPTLASRLHTAAAPHAGQLSNAVAIILLVVYLLSIPFWLGRERRTGRGHSSTDAAAAAAGTTDAGTTGAGTTGAGTTDNTADKPSTGWPLSLAVGLLAFGSLGSAVVSDWFVGALEPATKSLGLSQTFTGLVVVAIASNAVENVGGITFALKSRPDYAISTILNSPLQVALFLTPLLVLVSRLVGPTPLTLVFPALEVAALAVATVVVIVVIADGEYVWLEGVALIGLYGIAAAAFWWG